MEREESEIKEDSEVWASRVFFIIFAGCIAFMLAAYIFAFN
ncbi:MAG: hypothetical protein Ct9H300mP28_06130 [Pseudomonadota bacterium]|jgi:hypothetical protein|nr:MAG: hypothetical protein Ct9H300mP28_06130 [Pseudomonadota bacterium]|tara:strand:- start:235 stop:357 length:123 start_codon:yes stop_codon:yes gene_type:complete